MTKQTIVVAMMVVYFIQSSDAAEPVSAPWYADAAAGDASIHKSYPGTTRQSGPTWNLDVGYKIFRYLGLEGGFTRYPNTYITTTDGISASDTHYSYDVAVRGIFPFRYSGLELYGKLGIGRLNSNVTVNGPTGTNIRGKNYYSTGTFVGAGAQYYLLSNLALGLQLLSVSGNKYTGTIQFYGTSASVLFG